MKFKMQHCSIAVKHLTFMHKPYLIWCTKIFIINNIHFISSINSKSGTSLRKATFYFLTLLKWSVVLEESDMES